MRLGQAVMIPEPQAPHTGRDSGSTAHHRMGNAGSEGAQRTQAGGPRSILGEVTIHFGPLGCPRLGQGNAPDEVDRRQNAGRGKKQTALCDEAESGQGEAGEGLSGGSPMTRFVF